MEAFATARRAMGRSGFDTGVTGFKPIDPSHVTTASHYETLGISEDATEKEIKNAYRKAALQFHPDKNGSDSEAFQRAKDAYETLGDPERRQVYDVSRGAVQDDHDSTGGVCLGVPRGGSVVVRAGLCDIYRGCTRTVRFERYDTPTQGRMAVVQVRIPAGTPHLGRVVVPGEGNARVGGQRDDLVVVVRHVIPPGVAVEGNDVLCGATLTLAQAIAQVPFAVTRPDGTMVMATPPRAHTCGPGTWWRLAGHGLPSANGDSGGDLFVVVSVVFPPTLPDDTVALLRESFRQTGEPAVTQSITVAHPCCCPAPGVSPAAGEAAAGCPVQ